MGYSARELAEFGTSLVDRIRRIGAVSNDVALTPSSSQAHVTVSIPLTRPRRWDAARAGELVEVRLHKTGQVSLRATLPRDSMGSILDQDALPQQITALLRFTGALNLIQHERIAVAIGVSEPTLTQIDRFNPHQSRTRAELVGFGRSFTLQTEPDESTSLAALDTGAHEVAAVLARVLINQHPSAS